MRILFVLPELKGGGAERVVLDLLRMLERSRFECTLFLLKREGVYWGEVPAGVTLVAPEGYGRLRYRFPALLGRLLWHARQSALIVGALELEATYLAYSAGALARKRVIGWVHTVLAEQLKRVPPWHRRAVEVIYPRLIRVVFASHGGLESARGVVHLDWNRATVIPNLLDPTRLDRAASENLPEWAVKVVGKPTILGIGRLDSPKGFDVLIEAHARLRRTGLDHHLLILGDGPLRADLKLLVKRLSVEDTVFMPGFTPNPYPIMKRTSLFVLSSRFEGLPVVVLEALTLGLPVVATDCPGTGEILDAGRYGLIVPRDDPGALAQAVAKVLRDPALRAKLSGDGLARARSFFPESVVPRWEDLFRELAS
ncbi:MAG: glycosyltransferase [bacterium]